MVIVNVAIVCSNMMTGVPDKLTTLLTESYLPTI